MSGFALRRNGSCLSSETECNPTAGSYYACCPFGSVCSNPYNQVCCLSTNNCTSNIVNTPVCGDSSWTLFNNGGVAGGYFCCLGNQTGYSVEGVSDGCASPGYVLQSGESELKSIPYAQSIATSTSSAQPATSSLQTTPNTSTTTTPPSNSSSTILTNPPLTSTTKSPVDTRGIIGGAVGGTLAAIAIICVVFAFMYRRRRNALSPISPGPTELFAGSRTMELMADKKQPRELFAYDYPSPQSYVGEPQIRNVTRSTGFPRIAAELDATAGRDMLENNRNQWRAELPSNPAYNNKWVITNFDSKP